VRARVVADYRQLAPLIERERSAGRRVALANGCFDVLHVGHVRLLGEARRHCDVLVVALNSDESTRASKGPSRPLVPLVERLEVVAALAAVDYVTSFAEPTADAIIRALRPALLVKGTDRTPEDVPERDTLSGCGGRVLICGDPKSHSSTDLIRRLRS
jgi:rfaE bifunctional protein nucleotidyltransferase chain/domain